MAFRIPRWADAVIGGWNLSTVTLVQSGFFQTPLMSAGLDRSNTNVAGRFGAFARPDRIGDGNLANPTPSKFYDITAFPAPPVGAGRFGKAGVGILRGPHTATISAGLFKSVSISEHLRLRLEGTFTNIANHPNFALPSANISQPSFGMLTQVISKEVGGNRTGQIGVRLEF